MSHRHHVSVTTPPRQVTPQQNAHHQWSMCWRKLASGRSARTPNLQGREDGLGWWSWLRRSEVAGQARQRSFCKDWPRLAPSLCRGSFRSVWKPHGFDVGVASWLAAQHVLSRRPSWSADQPLAPVARSPR